MSAMNSVEHEVERSWERIGAWLRSHARKGRRIGPVVDGAHIDAAERALGRALPPDLVALWRLEDVDADHWLPPAGGCALQGPRKALDLRSFLLEIAEDEDPADPMWPDRFGPELLPIAMSGGGDSLVVDLRAGETHDAVFFWDHEVWGLKVPLWPGVAAMLTDTADAWSPVLPRSHGTPSAVGTNPLVPIVNERNEFEGWDVLS